MASTAAGHRRGWIAGLSPAQLGLVGQTSTSWGVAGGLGAVVVVCGHIVAGRLSSSVAFLTASLFFLAGSAIGFLHGCLLGYLGRPADVTRGRALLRLALGAGYSIPVLIVGWIVAMAMTVSATAYLAGRYLTLAPAALGWLAAAGFFVWAWVETRLAWAHLQRRWPDARPLLVTVGLALGALIPIFLVTRPEIWLLGVRPTTTAAVGMALVAAAWIVGPAVILVLLAIRAVRPSLHAPSVGEVSDA